MGKHVLEGLHVLRGVADKLVLAERGQVDLSIPMVLAVKQLLVDLVGFF